MVIELSGWTPGGGGRRRCLRLRRPIPGGDIALDLRAVSGGRWLSRSRSPLPQHGPTPASKRPTQPRSVAKAVVERRVAARWAGTSLGDGRLRRVAARNAVLERGRVAGGAGPVLQHCVARTRPRHAVLKRRRVARGAGTHLRQGRRGRYRPRDGACREQRKAQNPEGARHGWLPSEDADDTTTRRTVQATRSAGAHARFVKPRFEPLWRGI